MHELEVRTDHFLHMPLFWLVVCLCAFHVGQVIYQKSGYKSCLSPIITATFLLIVMLFVTHVSYGIFLRGTELVSFFLGPATVSLAVPIYEQRAKLAKLWLPLGLGLTVGALVGMVSSLLLGKLLGLSHDTLLSLVPKSVTTPIAMDISKTLGGLPDLTAAMVVLTGILGALMGPMVLRWFGVMEDPVRGASLGATSHGMGTSTAFQLSQEAGAFSGLAMGMTGVISALLAPLVIKPVMAWLGVG